MKVLVVLDSFYPNVDGPIEVVVSVAKKFKEKGFGEMELLVPSYPETVEVDGIKINRVISVPAGDGYRGALPALSAGVKKLIKKGGFDIIHLHSPFTLGRYALKIGHKCGLPVIFTMHTKFRDEFQRRLKSRLLQKFMMRYIMGCINRCDVVTTVSQGTVDTLGEYGYKNTASVKVIRNATSMPPSAADTKKTAELKSSFAENGEIIFSYVGRLAQTKNIQFSLKVLAEVKKRGYGNFKFVIVGSGDYGRTLKKLTEELNLTENVIFAGKITDKKLLACYYSAFDALLFPSVFDNASIVILEAAANSLPVITYKGSCSAEKITNGESGFVWDNDADVWTENLIKLINEPDLAKTAGEGARKHVYAGWDEITEEYALLYADVLKERTR